jgi:hypothetical protein
MPPNAFGAFQITIFTLSPPPQQSDPAADEKQSGEKQQKAVRKERRDQDRRAERQRAKTDQLPLFTAHAVPSFPHRAP